MYGQDNRVYTCRSTSLPALLESGVKVAHRDERVRDLAGHLGAVKKASVQAGRQ